MNDSMLVSSPQLAPVNMYDSTTIATPPTGKCNVKSFENRLFYVEMEGNQAIGYDRVESMTDNRSYTHNTSLVPRPLVGGRGLGTNEGSLVPRPLGGRGLGTDKANITLNLSKGIYFYLQSVSCLDAG